MPGGAQGRSQQDKDQIQEEAQCLASTMHVLGPPLGAATQADQGQQVLEVESKAECLDQRRMLSRNRKGVEPHRRGLAGRPKALW